MNVPEFNSIALRTNGRPLYRAVVISAHGIRTRGEWQKRINVPLTDAGFLHEMADFGHISFLRAALPQTASAAANIVAEHFYRNLGAAPRIHAIGHSFGSLAIGKALQMHPDVRLERIILWGSVLRTRFPWQYFFDRGQVSAVLNEVCRRDPAPRAACIGCALHRGGASGALGFKDTPGQAVINQFYVWTQHGRLGTALHCQQTWAPFLQTGAPMA